MKYFIEPNSVKINDQFWFESHFYSMPQETRDSVRNLINSINLRKLWHYKDKAVESKLGVVVGGQEYPVYMGDFTAARYVISRSAIELPYGTLNIDEMLTQIEHEVGHILDKKIGSDTWRGTSQQYGTQSDASYFKEPIEFDAIGSGFDSYIKSNFENLSSKEKILMIDRFNTWLRYGGEVPYFNQEITFDWKTKPTLWRKFQQRVYNLVQELEKMKG